MFSNQKTVFGRRIAALVLMLLMLVSSAAIAEEPESEWTNILLLGGDARSLSDYGRTDTMIILSVNREESALKMTSIMRDTWVELPNGIKGKINAANVYGGPEGAVKTVNECFGTDIDQYVLINMAGLVEMIDLLGGVEIEITESERKYANDYAASYQQEVQKYDGDSVLEKSGLVHMNGLMAMSYARNRYTDSDYGRVMRQQNVLLAMAKTAQEKEVSELMEMVDDFTAFIDTNMTNEELKEIAMVGLVIETEDVEQFRVPADGTFSSGTFDGTWMIRPDLAENAELLKAFIYGK